MKLFPGKVSIIAAEIAATLISDGDLVSENTPEVELDIVSVLKEYIRIDRELTEKAKDTCEQKSLPYTQQSKIKKQLADKQNFVTGEDAADYLMDQIIGTFMHSQWVDDIYAEDHELKRKMRNILRRHTEIEDELDNEVRAKIRNLEEGTQNWEIEYAKAMQQVKRRRGLV